MLVRTQRLVAAGAVLSCFLSACGDGGNDGTGQTSPSTGPGAVTMQDATATYAAGVHASYVASRASALLMDEEIDAFLEAPTAESLAAARAAWVAARADYGPTEAFRFYGGPIDDAETGKEILINAWPLDEAHIDYVVGDPQAGIINHPELYPVIDGALLVALNEDGGETNISTGWHAIEFLLWGQDLSEDGPGDRPVADYTTNPNADRRARYLAAASDLLVTHLGELVDAWAPGAENYRAQFEALDPAEAMMLLLSGVGELSRGELAGQRMNVAYSERSQEDEHSCFSDNTTADLAGNASGIQMVLEATYPNGVSGPSVLDVLATRDASLASQLRTELAASVAAVRAIPAPFDQHIRDGVPDTDPGRAAVLTAIIALEKQTVTISRAASALTGAANPN